MVSGDAIGFSDLPMLTDDDDVRRVHHASGLYFVKRNGKAHADMTCGHLEDTTFVGNPVWRVATSEERRTLGIPWCDECA